MVFFFLNMIGVHETAEHLTGPKDCHRKQITLIFQAHSVTLVHTPTSIQYI